jgi:hypothetical protein
MQRSRAVYPLTILLTLATVVGIFAAGWVLANPAVADPGPAASKESVRAFYAAVNQTIRFGDPTALEGTVDEHVVTHGSLASIAPDRAGLIRYLMSLHATSPHVELKVGEITTTGSRAMVSISPIGANEGAFLGSPLAGNAPWGGVDAVRINNHRVVELWSDASGLALLESLARAQVTIVIPSDRIVSLDRLSILEDTTIVAPGSSDLRWLHVENGDVAVEAHGDHAVPLDPSQSMSSASTNVARTVLHPGDLIGIPTRARTEVRNVGKQSASVLVFTIALPQSDSASMDPAYPQAQPSTVGETGLPKWWTGERPATMEPAPFTSLVGELTMTLPAGQLVLATGRATLTPKASLSDFELPGSSILVVNAGTLDVVSDGELVISNNSSKMNRSAGRLEGKTVGMLGQNARANLHNPESNPLVVTIFAILPASALTNP